MKTVREDLEDLLLPAVDRTKDADRRMKKRKLGRRVHKTRMRRASAKALGNAELIYAEARGTVESKVLLPLVQAYLSLGVDLVQGLGDRGFADRLSVFLNTNLPTLGGTLLGSKE